MHHRVGCLRHLIEQNDGHWLKEMYRFVMNVRDGGAMPPRPAGRNVASEAEAPLHMWVAVRVGRCVHDHQDFKVWVLVPPLFP